jgi:hypothetical protein
VPVPFFLGVYQKLKPPYLLLTQPNSGLNGSHLRGNQPRFVYSTQEASERRNCHCFCGLCSPDCANITREKGRASFQSMRAENGSTGSMAFLRRLFREL